jgi:phenylpropionate dioxygenase-like ring-hydroxylating dioxygenase large terminal subunit
LFFGRNEEQGLRCVYHGWKFDVHGTCVDVPSEPPESQFKQQIKLKAYPTYESGGVVWVYMGPTDHQPDRPPDLPFTLVPEEERSGIKFLVESNFLQNLEGELDTAHVSFLHSTLDDGASLSNLVRLDGYNNDRLPRLTVIDKDYGFVYGGRRTKTGGDFYWRVTTVPASDLRTHSRRRRLHRWGHDLGPDRRPPLLAVSRRWQADLDRAGGPEFASAAAHPEGSLHLR